MFHSQINLLGTCVQHSESMPIMGHVRHKSWANRTLTDCMHKPHIRARTVFRHCETGSRKNAPGAQKQQKKYQFLQAKTRLTPFLIRSGRCTDKTLHSICNTNKSIGWLSSTLRVQDANMCIVFRGHIREFSRSVSTVSWKFSALRLF